MVSKWFAWAVANPEASFALFASIVALIRGVYALVSRLVAPYPRLRAGVEAIAALGPDVLRFALQAGRAVTGKPLPSLALDTRDEELARLREVVARQAAQLTSVSEAKTAEAPSSTEKTP